MNANSAPEPTDIEVLLHHAGQHPPTAPTTGRVLLVRARTRQRQRHAVLGAVAGVLVASGAAVAVAVVGHFTTTTVSSAGADDPRVSTSRYYGGGAQANIEGTLTIRSQCLGIAQGNTFIPVVLQRGTFTFVDGVLAFDGTSTALGSRIVLGGGFHDQPLPSSTGAQMAEGCTAYPSVAMIGTSSPPPTPGAG